MDSFGKNLVKKTLRTRRNVFVCEQFINLFDRDFYIAHLSAKFYRKVLRFVFILFFQNHRIFLIF